MSVMPVISPCINPSLLAAARNSPAIMGGIPARDQLAALFVERDGVMTDIIGLSAEELWNAIPSAHRQIFFSDPGDYQTMFDQETILNNMYLSGILNNGDELLGNDIYKVQYSSEISDADLDRAYRSITHRNRLPLTFSAQKILIVGESILNASSLISRIKTTYPTAVVTLSTYGGPLSPMGLFQLANDILAYTDPSNLIKNTDLTAWSQTNTVPTLDVYPSNGEPCYKLSAAGVGGQRITLSGHVAPADLSVTYSVKIEPGTATSLRLMIYNNTRSATALQSDEINLAESSHLTPGPKRYSVSGTLGGGTVQGDSLTVYIYVNPITSTAGVMYASEPIFNVGPFIPPFQAKSGTAGTPAGKSWVATAGGTDRSLYNMIVLQYGRNDRSAISASHHSSIMLAMVNVAKQFAKRVIIAAPPPEATADRLSWASDLYVSNGLKDEDQAVAESTNVHWYDAVTDFKSVVEAGDYTIAEIMRDQYHPTIVTPGDDGLELYNDFFEEVLSSTRPGYYSGNSVSAIARLGGVPTGSWSFVTYQASGSFDPSWMLSSLRGNNRSGVMQSTTANDTLTFSMSCSGVCLIFLGDSSTVGVVEVIVDSLDPIEVNCQISGLTTYPASAFIKGGLDITTHTIVVRVKSGTARIFGVVGW